MLSVVSISCLPKDLIGKYNYFPVKYVFFFLFVYIIYYIIFCNWQCQELNPWYLQWQVRTSPMFVICLTVVVCFY